MTAETIFVGKIRAYFNKCRTLEATEVSYLYTVLNSQVDQAWYLYNNRVTARIVIGWCLSSIRVQAPVVQRVDNAIHRINRYPADKC